MRLTLNASACLAADVRDIIGAQEVAGMHNGARNTAWLFFSLVHTQCLEAFLQVPAAPWLVIVPVAGHFGGTYKAPHFLVSAGCWVRLFLMKLAAFITRLSSLIRLIGSKRMGSETLMLDFLSGRNSPLLSGKRNSHIDKE